MPRPRRDGTPHRKVNRRVLTELHIRKARGEATAYNVWDAKERGLVLRVQPSGARSFKFVYSKKGRAQWVHLGNITLSAARAWAAELRYKVARGEDVVAERKAKRTAITFGELHQRYLSEHAMTKNKSWEQAAYLVRAHLLKPWSNLEAASITRSDAKDIIAAISSPSVQNQTVAALSAVFSWAMKEDIAGIKANPASKISRNQLRSRERVLSDTEVMAFWKAFDEAGLVRGSALKVILLCGQRPGEVTRMRREHIKDNWWELPGLAVPSLGWIGTKNSANHRVFLCPPVRKIIADLGDGDTGFVFANDRGNPVSGLDAAMRAISLAVGVREHVRPHDLRRTFASAVTRLGHGRDCMNRLTNHVEGGIAGVYDRYAYEEENRKVMESVADHFMRLAYPDANVVRMAV
jgi:integrase